MTLLPADLLIHTVTKVRPVTTPNADSYKATVRDYGAGATRTEVKARIQQDTRAEVYLDGRTPAEQRWQMFTNDPDVDRHDQIEWGTLTFEVFGQPEPTYDGTAFHHTEATLRIIDG